MLLFVEASDHKWVNSIINGIGVNSLRSEASICITFNFVLFIAIKINLTSYKDPESRPRRVPYKRNVLYNKLEKNKNKWNYLLRIYTVIINLKKYRTCSDLKKKKYKKIHVMWNTISNISLTLSWSRTKLKWSCKRRNTYYYCLYFSWITIWCL